MPLNEKQLKMLLQIVKAMGGESNSTPVDEALTKHGLSKEQFEVIKANSNFDFEKATPEELDSNLALYSKAFGTTKVPETAKLDKENIAENEKKVEEVKKSEEVNLPPEFLKLLKPNEVPKELTKEEKEMEEISKKY